MSQTIPVDRHPDTQQAALRIAAIENILSYDYPDLELCVHDNSDDDHIQQYLQSRTPDPRLTYKRICRTAQLSG